MTAMPQFMRLRSLLSIRLHLLLLLCASLCQQHPVQAWTLPSRQFTNTRRVFVRSKFALQHAETASVPIAANTRSDDTTDEYEYLEYENLTEDEFVNSEWLVGTNWDNNPKKIDETWVRLVVESESGKNLCFWGDGSEGKWNLDVASQFLSISKESLAGKQIWACTVDDYYYLQGTVRGWTFWSAAAVLGQWQAKRLGIDKEEAGTPPWFLPQEQEEETTIQKEQEENGTEISQGKDSETA